MIKINMKYNFDNTINRKNTYSRKWDPEILKEMFGRDDLLPLWVADMEFRVAKPIEDAIINRANHPIYGYSKRPESYYDAIVEWINKRFDYKIEKEWIMYTPGVVPAINYIIQAFTDEKDSIMIQEPVYYPFRRSIENNNRNVVNSSLEFDGERYNINFKDIEEKIQSENVKIFILCSPHNPIGRVWTKTELEKIGNICLENDVLIVSDEIHSDLVYESSTHTMFASINKDFEMNSITCTAPSKTFNLAGMEASNIIIPNSRFREKFQQILDLNNIGFQNPLSIAAVESAYREGEDWLEQLLKYLQGNIEFIEEYLNKNLPKAKFIKPQATYLAWIDLRKYESNGEILENKIINKGKIALNGGTWFGKDGEGFMRLNFACSRSMLEEGLKRLSKAINE